MRYPTVLLVGRTNVGKSTLFNRLISKKKSIVFDQEGVTRDYLEELVSWDNKTFKLVDTGGFSFKKGTSDIDKHVQTKVRTLLQKADLLLFICDIKNGPTNEDKLIADTLRKVQKPMVLILNKADNTHIIEENTAEFYELGFQDIIPISSIHGTGVSNLLEKIIESIHQQPQENLEQPKHSIVIVGKPNVGKSSLMNLLINQERSIVSEQAGTTREAISENVYHCSDLIQITDTAGVRRKSRINEDLEELMVKSSLSAIREANIILLVIDASEGKIADQELKLLFHSLEYKKPLIIIFNKSDLLEQNLYAKDQLQQDMVKYDFILSKIPHIFISCLSKKNVGKIINMVKKVLERCKQDFNAIDLIEIVKNALERKPLFHKKIPLKVFSIKNIKQAPIPTFLLLVNYPQWFGETQLGFIENIIRKNFDLKGCPIKFEVQRT